MSCTDYHQSLMLCLACHQRKRLISMFRLAHWRQLSRTAPYSRLSLGACSVALELSSNPGLLAFGSCDPFFCRLQAGSQACRTSWQAKGPPGDLLRLQGSNPWTLEQPTSRDEDRAEASRRLFLPNKENKYCGLLFYLYRLFGKALGGWLRLVDQGTILVGPRERTAHPSLWVIVNRLSLKLGASWLAS